MLRDLFNNITEKDGCDHDYKKPKLSNEDRKVLEDQKQIYVSRKKIESRFGDNVDTPVSAVGEKL